MDVDHVLPQALGGTDELENLRAAHPNCNRRAGYAVLLARREARAVPTVPVQVDVPPELKQAITSRAERERRSRNAEIQAMLEWALKNMPEQLASP